MTVALSSFANTVREAAAVRGALASDLVSRNQGITGDLSRSLETLSSPEVMAILRQLDSSGTKLSGKTTVAVDGLVLEGGRANSIALTLQDDAPKVVASSRGSSVGFDSRSTNTARGVVDCDTVNFAETDATALEAALLELFGKVKGAIDSESQTLRAKLGQQQA